MAEIRYVFMDSQSETPYDKSQREYWYEKLKIHRRTLQEHHEKAYFDADIEEIGKCEIATHYVDSLLAKCHETVRMEVVVSAPEVNLFDLQRAVGLIQSITGIQEDD